MLGALLALGLAAGSVLVYFFGGELDDPRRVVMALAVAGFFGAPLSERPLRLAPWLLAVAVVAWGAQVAGSGRGGIALWLACSVAGSFLVVRSGSRAAWYYLPEAGSEAGAALRQSIRGQLQIAVGLFLAAYVFGSLSPGTGAVVVAVSAAFFLRYVLLQAKHLGVFAAPLPSAAGIVPAQRWILLLLFAAVGATSFPERLLGERGGGPLLVTAAFLAFLAALVFVLALVRTGWPRAVVRRGSFAAGVVLAVAITAVLVELEFWDRSRYRVFASSCIVFLVVLPFVKRQTKLFEKYPRFSELLPPPMVAVMMAPVTAVSGARWSLATTVFLFALASFQLAHDLLVAFRAGSRERVYLSASLALLLYLFFSGGGSRAWQVFLLSLGFVLYGVDLFERMWRKSGARERIQA